MDPSVCAKCEGCGQVADTEDEEPWSRWMELPLKNSVVVVMGLVKPKPCPECSGKSAGAGDSQ